MKTTISKWELMLSEKWATYSYDLKTKFETAGFFLIDNNKRIEFGSKVPNPYKEYPHFKDRSLFGSFEIAIDRNKKITLVHQDIGEEIDGLFYSASFR